MQSIGVTLDPMAAQNLEQERRRLGEKRTLAVFRQNPRFRPRAVFQPKGVADIARRRAIALAKAAIEIRKIAKADLIGQRADPTGIEIRVGEGPISAPETLAEQIGRKGAAVALEQFLQVARRH